MYHESKSRNSTAYYYKMYPTHPYQNQRGTIFYGVIKLNLDPKTLKIFTEIQLENFVPRFKGQNILGNHELPYLTHTHQNLRITIFYEVFMPNLGPKIFKIFKYGHIN